jgi:hypothetical protein
MVPDIARIYAGPMEQQVLPFHVKPLLQRVAEPSDIGTLKKSCAGLKARPIVLVE